MPALSSAEQAQVLVAEVRRLRQLLAEYGRHAEGCNAQFGDRYRCRCGWREVEAGFAQQAREEEPEDAVAGG